MDLDFSFEHHCLFARSDTEPSDKASYPMWSPRAHESNTV